MSTVKLDHFQHHDKASVNTKGLQNEKYDSKLSSNINIKQSLQKKNRKIIAVFKYSSWLPWISMALLKVATYI